MAGMRRDFHEFSDVILSVIGEHAALGLGNLTADVNALRHKIIHKLISQPDPTRRYALVVRGKQHMRALIDSHLGQRKATDPAARDAWRALDYVVATSYVHPWATSNFPA